MRYILTILLLTSCIYAKTADFSIIIDEKFNNALLDVTEDHDRSISAVGFVKKYKDSSSISSTAYSNAFDYLSSLSSSSGSQMHLVKVDGSAEIVLRRSMDLSKFNEAKSLIKTPQNGYFVGGHTLEASLVLLKLDSGANKIFVKEFGTQNHDRMSKLLSLRDGGVLVIGSSTASSSQSYDVFNDGLGLNDIYIARFSKNGIMLWSKKYGSYEDDAGIDAAEADDGSIVVLGKVNKDNSTGATIMRITEYGDKLWLHQLNQERKITPHKIIKLRDSSFAISLSQQDEMNKEQIRLIKIDLQKNILLDKTIHTTYSSVLKDIGEYSDGRIAAVGYVQDSYDTDGLAMLLDSKFSMLLQEHYGSRDYDSFNALDILHDSKIAVAGVHTNQDSQETNMWLLKLNQDLSLSQISYKSTDFYSRLNEIFRDEIKRGELVVKEDLSINFSDEKLYFKVGEYKLTDFQKRFLDSFGKKLFAFLYDNKDKIATLEINGHTSSEWGDSDFSQSYINNERLSMNRSFATLSYMFKSQDENRKKWLSEVLKGSGLSFSKKIVLNDVEDKERSRRASFKILLLDK